MNFFILYFIIFLLFHASYYNYFFGEKRSQYTLTRNAIWANYCPRPWTKETVYEPRLWLTSPNVTKSGNFLYLWIPESRKFTLVEAGFCALESGVPVTVGIGNPSSTDKESRKFQFKGIRNARRGIQNPRLPWIPLPGATHGNINLFNDPCFNFTCRFIVQGFPPPPPKKKILLSF